MNLYVIRHAAAESAQPDLNDDARPLTKKGCKRFKKVAKGLKKSGVRFDRLYHSPLLRAVQTAELLAPVLRGDTVVTSNLNCAPSEALLAELSGERVALVGHAPYTNQLVAWLTLGNGDLGEKIAFDKGGVAWLEGTPEPGGMTLRALLPPDLIRALV